MPLQHSGSKDAFKSNVKTLMGDVGKSPHVASRDQALAIAYAVKRRGRAEGGMVDDPIIPPPSDAYARQTGDMVKGAANALLWEPGQALGETLKRIADSQASFGDYVDAGMNVAGAIPAGALTKAGSLAAAVAPIFHGTSRVGRAAIRANGLRAGSEGAAFVTDSPKDAYEFALMRSKSKQDAKVMKGSLDDDGFKTVNVKGEIYDPNMMEEILSQAKAEGYPGVRIRNIQNFEHGSPSDSWAIFDPSTAKFPGKGDPMKYGGALDVAYAIKRQRRYGGRAGYDDGGPVEPPGDDAPFQPPLFLQSGTEDVPTRTDTQPTRNYRGRPVADWSQRDPDAAYETSVDRLRYLRDNPSAAVSALGVTGGIVGAAMDNASDRAQQRGLAPMGAPRRPSAAPESSSPLLAGVGNIFDMSAHAGEDGPPAAPVIDPTAKEAAEIARVNALIAGKRTDLARATRQNPNPKTPTPRMTALEAEIAGFERDLAKTEGPNSPLGLRRAAALDVHKEDVRRWNEARAALAQRKTESQLPYAVKYPERQEWLQENMPKFSGATGMALGLLGRGKMLKPLGLSVGAGAAEGAATAAWPTLQDTEFLPPGQTWSAAADRVRNIDSDFLTRVGSAAGTHALIAGGASLAGSKARDLAGQMGEGAANFRAWMKKPSAEPPPVAGVGAAPEIAAAPKPKTAPQLYHMPDGTVLKKYDFGSGGVRWMSGGKFIKASDADAIRAQHAAGAPSGTPATLHAPQMESQGGGIKSPMDVAYAVRRQQRAEGGVVHAGPILSSVPGRTDNHPMDVAEGSYILPADHVSSLGEGNTSAGMEVINHMIGSLGVDGHDGGESKPVPINAAGGEFAIPPEVVAAIGGGDIARGHEMLDDWVLLNRKKHIRTLSKLPGPAKS